MSDNLTTSEQIIEPVAPATTPAVAPAEQTVQPTDPNSLFADQLQAIKSDDGRQKYADVPTALASVSHAQTHIAEQAQKIKELEETVAQQQGMEEVLAQLKSQQTQAELPSTTGIDETTLASLLDQRLDQRDNEARQNANASTVLTKLKTVFGDKAEQQFTSKANELGISVPYLSDMARQAPQAVLAYFNETATPHTANPTTTTVNTNVLQTKQPNPDMSHMDVFTGGTSSSVTSWREAAKT